MTAGLTVPVLPAGPFRLRPFTLGDVDVVREAARDPYIPLITTVPVPCTDGAGRQFIERQWGRAQDGTGYSFAIADAGTGRAAGQIGLWLRDIGQGRATIGYWVAPPARGQHAAGHALTAVARWAFGGLGIPRLELCVEPWNLASARTAFITGFRREGRLRSWRDVGGNAWTSTCMRCCFPIPAGRVRNSHDHDHPAARAAPDRRRACFDARIPGLSPGHARLEV